MAAIAAVHRQKRNFICAISWFTVLDSDRGLRGGVVVSGFCFYYVHHFNFGFDCRLLLQFHIDFNSSFISTFQTLDTFIVKHRFYIICY